jgi:hypothetical protein
MAGMVPLDLLIAVRSKGIRFRAWAIQSFRATMLYLRNEGANDFHLDVSRYGLTARTGTSQTIGLSHPVGSEPGAYVLVLKAGEEKEIAFNSRCLNSQGKSPRDGTEYKIVPDRLANDIIDLLRRGAEQEEVWNTTANREERLTVRLEIPARVDKF